MAIGEEDEGGPRDAVYILEGFSCLEEATRSF
jgi:hypothetical protein